MKKIPFALLLFFLSLSVNAQSQVSVSIGKNLATIGDPIEVRIIIKSPKPLSGAVISGHSDRYEILKEDSTDPRASGSGYLLQKTLWVAFFQTGDFEMGPLTVEIQYAGEDQVEQRKTASVPLTIQSTLEGEKDIKPIKDPVSLAGTPLYILKYLLPILLIAALMFFLLRHLSNQRKRRKAPSSLPLSPLEELEKRIRELKDQALFDQDRKKEFSLELTRIIKDFLDRNYTVQTGDLTTTETMDLLQKAERLESLQKDFQFLFSNCDQIKFARYNPGLDLYNDVMGRLQEVIDIYRQRYRKENTGTGEEGKPEGKI